MQGKVYLSITGFVVGVLMTLSAGEAGIKGQRVLTPFNIIIEGRSPYYQPAQSLVRTGVPVRWVNPTATPHTVTEDQCGRGRSCLFHSGAIGPDQHFTIPGLPPGRYPYHCELHPIMRGVITIIEDRKPQQTNWNPPESLTSRRK